MVTVPLALLSERFKQSPQEFVTDEMTGAVPSYVQVNWLAAVLGLSQESVNVPAATSIVVAPSPVGVNVAV